MQTKLTSARRTDALDYEAFEDMLTSRPFGVFLNRVHDALAVAVHACTRTDDETQLRRAQGQAAAYRTVLGLPELIKAEMRPKKGK